MSGIRLTEAEKTMVLRIVAYGDGHGFSDAEIRIAVKAAYIESTLGSDMKTPKPTPENPHPTAKGLYQYTDPTWLDRHPQLGDKNVIDHQITAFFDDLAQDKTSYQRLPTDVKEKLRFDEYVYIGHKLGINSVQNHIDKNDFDGVFNNEATTLWDSDKRAKLFDPAWIDEARSRNPIPPELPDQLLNQVEPQTIMDAIESGMAGGLAFEAIAGNLADLSILSTDRQMLIDAWICLLENAGKDKLAQIDTVSQSENRIQFEFQNGDKAALTSHSSGAEVVQLSADDDFTSNWWKIDGSYGTNTQAADNSVSSTSYDADGNYTVYTDHGQGSITRNSYAPDGSYSTYTEDGLGNITMNNTVPDGSFNAYASDGRGNITINNSASDGSFSTITDDGLGNISNTSYAADGSFSSYTDDGQGNIALNDYAPDGTPVDDANIIADDNSGNYPDSNYAQDNSANQASNDNTNWNT
ncbi:MAG: hypothetical protein ACYC43_13345 [Burkholderiales bacterium]